MFLRGAAPSIAVIAAFWFEMIIRAVQQFESAL